MFFLLIMLLPSSFAEVENDVDVGGVNYDYIYNLSDANYVLTYAESFSNDPDNTNTLLDLDEGYNHTPSGDTWLNQNYCKSELNQNPRGKYQIKSNFDLSKQNFITALQSINNQSLADNILETNYYMKTFAAIEVRDSSGNVVNYILPEGTQKYSYNNNDALLDNVINNVDLLKSQHNLTGNQLPYVLSKPNTQNISFNNNMREFCSSNNCFSPEYSYNLVAIPIDGKCDYNNDDSLELDQEVQNASPMGINMNQEDSNNNNNYENHFLNNLLGDMTSRDDATQNQFDNDKDGVIDAYEIPSCVGEKGKIFFGGCSEPKYDDLGNFKLPNHEMFDKFREIKINESEEYVEIISATKTKNKLEYHYSDEAYYFVDENDNKQKLSDDFSFRKFLNYKEEHELTKREILSPDNYMLDMFLIRPFANKDEVEDFVQASKDVFNSTQINKSRDVSNGQKNITLSLGNLSTNNPTTMYIIFDKSTKLEEIIPKNSNGKFFIQEKDPIIGWYFNGSEDNGDASYEVPEDSEDGTIVLTHEPILFNEGELIVNYRNTNCVSNETELFQLDSLEDSNIYSNGDKNFKVCLAHVEEDVGNLTSYSNKMSIGNITASNLFTREDSGETIGASINKPEGENYVWDMKVQEENPNGNYSCIGSYQNDKFGDCNYNPGNRVWLHFGIDTIAPTTTIDVPVLSHSLYINIDVEEEPIFGSGLREINYCISDSSSTCNPEDGEKKDLSGKDANFKIQESCETDSGCRKKLRYFSVDEYGNKEDVKEYNLNIIDKASSCQQSCLSVPSPNRYLKECNGVNSCNFYEKDGDGGEEVANLCDLQIKDSWVKYNNTHQIQCPDGPIKKTSMTDQNLDIQGESCNIIRTFPYPIVFNGKSMIMNIISCIA